MRDESLTVENVFGSLSYTVFVKRLSDAVGNKLALEFMG